MPTSYPGIWHTKKAQSGKTRCVCYTYTRHLWHANLITRCFHCYNIFSSFLMRMALHHVPVRVIDSKKSFRKLVESWEIVLLYFPYTIPSGSSAPPHNL